MCASGNKYPPQCPRRGIDQIAGWGLSHTGEAPVVTDHALRLGAALLA